MTRLSRIYLIILNFRLRALHVKDGQFQENKKLHQTKGKVSHRIINTILEDLKGLLRLRFGGLKRSSKIIKRP